VRLLLKRAVIDLETHENVAANRIFTIPVNVRRVRAPLKHHGAVRGVC
jgi:hypothetical protein